MRVQGQTWSAVAALKSDKIPTMTYPKLLAFGSGSNKNPHSFRTFDLL
jgi:hypothetical protein